MEGLVSDVSGKLSSTHRMTAELNEPKLNGVASIENVKFCYKI